MVALLVVLSLGFPVQALNNDNVDARVADMSRDGDAIKGEYVDGQVIIKLKEGVSLDDSFMDKHQLKSAEKMLKAGSKKNKKADEAMKSHGLDRIYLAEFSSEKSLTRILEKLNKNPDIEFAEPNYVLSIDAVPNDPSFSQLWGIHNLGQTGGAADADIDAPEAWDVQTGSSDVVIAVIDTGVDYNHPDLVSNIWTNLGEIPGNGIDDDGNGYVDDVHGYDFANNNGDPTDDHYHGTHCAGTIGAGGNNGIGIAGVNWNVSIMPVKFLTASGSGTEAGAIASIQYAILMGADVMSNSWGGGGYSQALYDAISAANDAGIIFVAAAGNTGSDNDVYPHYPSSYDIPNVIAVAATDHNDNKASFSCYGSSSVDLGAPGVNIYSTGLGNTYQFLSGTSMACPHVAGAAGLIKAQYPDLSSDEIKEKLFLAVDPIPTLDGKTVTGGRLNVYNCFEDDDISPSDVIDLAITDVTFSFINLTWTAVGDDGNAGTASEYDIRYSTSEITEGNWDNAVKVTGEPNPNSAGSVESHIVENLEYNTTYYFALKVIDNVKNYSGLSNIVSGTTESPTIVFNDDIESGVNGWTHLGNNDNWEIGAPVSGPGYSHSGSNSWATNLNGNYINCMDACLLMPSINLDEIESTQLMFQHYYNIENYYDGGIVEISTDGGISWTQITPNGGYPEDALYYNNPLGSVSAYSGYSGSGWHPAVFDISNYDGCSNVNIRFRFGTDYSIYYSGWYIDDVVVFGQSLEENQLPVANAGLDQTVSDADGNGTETITLNGSESYDPDGTIVSYLWFEEFDSVISPSPIGNGVSMSHDFSVGEHMITLIVTDDKGAIATDSVTAIVNPNQLPVANAGQDQTSFVEKSIVFDGSESYDPDGDIVSYEWNFGDGTNATGAIVNNIYDTAGDYTVVLMVTDNGGETNESTITVTIEDVVVADTVTITKAQYDSKKDILAITAISSGGREATLEVFSYGPMDYNPVRNLFSLTVYGITVNPGNITIKSSLGGEDIEIVTNKFKK